MQDFLLKDPWWMLALLVLPLVMWLRSRQPVAAILLPFAGAWWRPTLLVQPARIPAFLLGAGVVSRVRSTSKPSSTRARSDTR